MEALEQILNSIDDIVWGPVLLVLLVGTGIMLTIRLKGLQFTKLPTAIKLIFHSSETCSSQSVKINICYQLATTEST